MPVSGNYLEKEKYFKNFRLVEKKASAKNSQKELGAERERERESVHTTEIREISIRHWTGIGDGARTRTKHNRRRGGG